MFPPRSELEGPAEREQEQLLLIAGFGVEREAYFHPQRPQGRQPSHAAAGGVARVVDDVVLLAAVCVAGVDEDPALQPDRLHERKDHLVVDDDLRAAADGCARERLAPGVLAELPRSQGARLEAANRVDASRKGALEERQVGPA